MDMSPEERAAWYRLLAAAHRKRAAEWSLGAAAIETAEAFRKFAAAFQAGVERDIATHPDMAELNVRLDALYERP